MYQRAEQLIEKILHDGAGDSSVRLLKEFFDGYPVENLRRLLYSADARVVKVGAWIASELGATAAPLLDAFATLLNHPARYVRFFILDAILVCATDKNGDLLARALLLLRDFDAAVRWKALTFAAKASVAQLAASAQKQVDAQLCSLTLWLAQLENSNESAARLTAMLNSDVGIERLIAAAGALRLHSHNPYLLTLASESCDSDVASFAAEYLEILG